MEVFNKLGDNKSVKRNFKIIKHLQLVLLQRNVETDIYAINFVRITSPE